MLSYVKKCYENGYTTSFEPNLPKWHVFVKMHFSIFAFFGSAGRAEPFKFVKMPWLHKVLSRIANSRQCQGHARTYLRYHNREVSTNLWQTECPISFDICSKHVLTMRNRFLVFPKPEKFNFNELLRFKALKTYGKLVKISFFAKMSKINFATCYPM